MIEKPEKEENIDVLEYPNGDKYIGSVFEKKRDGFGVYISHFGDKFTIELWLKLKGDNVSLLKKDSFGIDIYNRQFKNTQRIKR